MNGCRNVAMVAAGAFGLAAGGGAVYGLYVDPTFRVLAIFIAGGVIMAAPLFVLAVWALRLAASSQTQQRVNHSYNYKVPQIPMYPQMPGQSGQAALGPGQGDGWEWPVVEMPAAVEEESPVA